MDNQNAASNSTFQTQQQIAQPAVETLLFNDIIEEKSLILRDLMDQFLQVHSYKRFDSEFNLFVKRIKHIAKDGQNSRNGTNLTQYMPPTVQMTSNNSAPPPSQLPKNCESQENIPQYSSVSKNTFQQPVAVENQLKTKLSHTDQLSNLQFTTKNVFNTIIEESLTITVNPQTNTQQPELLPPTATITYSGSPQIDNAMESNPELAESHGVPNNSDNTGTSFLNQDQLNSSTKSKVQYLTKWSVKTNQVKSKSGTSKSVTTLTGTLLAADKITVLNKHHRAGVLEVRKTKNIVKTVNGLYHLIGPILQGSPENLYHACVEINGIPKLNILKRLTTEVEVDHNKSMTRNGTIYNKKKEDSPSCKPIVISFGKNATLGSDLLNESNIHQQLSELSTAKNTKSFGQCHTPSELLKYRFHRKFVEAFTIVHGSED